MYGEKAEQAEELKMDLEDVKSMYKQQVNMHNLTLTPVICCKCNLLTVGAYMTSITELEKTFFCARKVFPFD